MYELNHGLFIALVHSYLGSSELRCFNVFDGQQDHVYYLELKHHFPCVRTSLLTSSQTAMPRMCVLGWPLQTVHMLFGRFTTQTM